MHTLFVSVFAVVLSLQCHCSIAVTFADGKVTKHFNEYFPPFDVWEKSPHAGCDSFSGCLDMADRENYLNPKATSIPCGFLVPSDLDRVRTYFEKDTKCKIVVFSFILGAYNFAYNPLAKKNFLVKDKEVCLFLFVDEATLMNGHGLEQLAPNHRNRHPEYRSAIVGGNATWKIILIKDLAASKTHGTAHIAKTIKLNGLRLFPNAEWVIYVDTKYVVRENPRRLVDYIKKKTNHSITAYGHFMDDVPSGFEGAVSRLYYLHSRFPNKNFNAEVKAIRDQYNFYKKEGLFDVYQKNLTGHLIDSAIVVAHNDNRARRFFCAWQNEVSLFSRHDQLSFHRVQHALQIFAYQIWKKEMLGGYNQFVQSVARVKPVHPKWNLFNESNPHPFTLHPSSSL